MRVSLSKLQDEKGLGLTEVLVAMLLFGILMAALAPLILKSVQTTARMTSIASANQLVIEGIDTLRVQVNGSAGRCQTVQDSDGGQLSSQHEDQRGIELTRVVSLTGNCASGELVTIHSAVTANSQSVFFFPGQVLSEASQQVFIGGS